MTIRVVIAEDEAIIRLDLRETLEAEGYDVVGIVEYPSRKRFVEIATSAKVQEIGLDRAAGLESQWLLATTTRPFPGEEDGRGD